MRYAFVIISGSTSQTYINDDIVSTKLLKRLQPENQEDTTRVADLRGASQSPPYLGRILPTHFRIVPKQASPDRLVDTLLQAHNLLNGIMREYYILIFDSLAAHTC